MSRNRPVRLAIPLAVIGGLAWLMVGCVYAPWFETARLTGTRQDFRPLAGNMVRCRATQETVRRLLGEPVERSSNDRVWVYTFDTSHGVWIEPLCFHVTAGGQYSYTLSLRFDEAGVVERQRVITTEVPSVIGLRDLTARPDDDGRAHVPYDAATQINTDNGVAPARYGDEHSGVVLPAANADYEIRSR